MQFVSESVSQLREVDRGKARLSPGELGHRLVLEINLENGFTIDS